MKRRVNKYVQKRKLQTGAVVSPLGQWEYPGQVTIIPNNNITMKGVQYPVLGVSDTGDVKMMFPDNDYKFDGNEVTEYPMQKAQYGLWNWIKETGRKVVDSEARKAPSYKSDISFKNAFDDAKNKGYKTFYWNGKYYNTKEKIEENEPIIKKEEFVSTEPQKKIAYGTNEETRRRVYDRFPVLRETTDSIAKAYNISPLLLRTRLAGEGFIDKIARDNDSNNGVSDFNAIRSGYVYFGTDDIPYYIESGLVNPINEKWSKVKAINEKDRFVFPAQGNTWRDNIGLMSATLQGLRNKAIEDFPGLSDDDYNRLANAYYNRGIKGGQDWWKGGGIGYNIIDYQTGGIHINPKNKGKFTAAAQRAGKSVQEYARQILANKENYSPKLIKRANFARNASKFKHQEGGNPEYEAMSAYINWKNRDKNFVKRGLNPNDFPYLTDYNGNRMTHLMAWSDVGDSAYVYPTIIQDRNGKLKQLNDDDAYNYAIENNEYIPFLNRKFADWYSKNGLINHKKHQEGGYEIGGEYDVTPEEYNRLKAIGYDIEVIDNGIGKHQHISAVGKRKQEPVPASEIFYDNNGNIASYLHLGYNNYYNEGAARYGTGEEQPYVGGTIPQFTFNLSDEDKREELKKKEDFINDVRNMEGYKGLGLLGYVAALSPLLMAAGPAVGHAAGTFVEDMASPIGLNFLKNLAIGTAGYEGVEQGTRGLNKLMYNNDKGWTATAKDLMFDKETQQKHPIVTDVAAAATNPGSYLGVGVKGLEYTGRFLPMLYNTFKNNARATYNVGKSLYNAANKIAKKSTTSLAKPAILNETDWDKLYFSAIKNGDMVEAQRLRDLHFKTKAPYTKYSQILYHGSKSKRMPMQEITIKSPVKKTYGFYTSPKKYIANGYIPEYYTNRQPIEFYMNIEKPYYFDNYMDGAFIHKDAYENLLNNGYDGAIAQLNKTFQPEIIGLDARKIKLSDAITYDNKGNIIPLSKRDNFNVNDVRYARDPSSYSAPYMKENRRQLFREDYTDFNIMVQRMNNEVQYDGVNPFTDGKMTGFRKWALNNGASPKKIIEVEKKYSKNNWEKLKQFKIDDYYTSYSPEDNTIYINKNEPEFNQIFPHEVEHKLFYLLFNENRNSITINEINKAFKSNDKFWSMPGNRHDFYFIGNNFEELLTRFTQIKNALGIKEQRALTEDELRRAYNMFKNGDTRFANNNMKEFFENIKDWKEAAKLSGKALSLSLILDTNQINEEE